MQIVNGYICMNCCDVDKARMGQDPHQSADQVKKQVERHLDRLAAGDFGPAVTLGGSIEGATDSTSQSQGPGSPLLQSSQTQGLAGGDSSGTASGLDILV